MASDTAPGLLSFFPFKKTRGFPGSWKSNWCKVVIKWGIPMFLTGFASFLSMWMLHLGTYQYVQVMLQWEEEYSLKNPEAHESNHSLSIGIRPTDLSFGALNDPLEYWLGYQKVPMTALDMVAAFFPMCFMLLAVLMDELGAFTKVMICHCFLALGKGAFGCMTVVPDSSGWANCKVRLGDEGIAYMSAKRTALEPFWAELLGINEDGKHLRWCADMMYSGHTYITCLYALGLYELVRIATRNDDNCPRFLKRLVIVVITVGEQAIEIYLVLLNRFHYTMDVVMAILLTLLFFTNGSISIVAKRWVQGARVKKKKSCYKGDEHYLHSDGDVLIPPCCLPFCCFTGREHLYSDNDIAHILDAEDKSFYETEDWRSELADSMRVSRKRFIPGGEYQFVSDFAFATHHLLDCDLRNNDSDSADSDL